MAFSGFPSAQGGATSAFGGFGATPTSTPGFGGFGTTAGTTPSFGAATGTAFGAATGTSGGFGATPGTGLFGAAQPALGQTAPAFGTSTAQGFGTSTSNASLFGGTGTTPAFGTTAPSAFGAATAGTAFGGTGTFGAPTSSAFGAPTSSTGFGGFTSFSAPTSSSGGTLFGNSGSTSGGGLFNTSLTTSAGTAFGGFPTGSLFGTTSTASTGFGGFGVKPLTTQTNAFTNFGTSFSQIGMPQQQSSLFGQQFNPLQQQQQAQPQEDPVVTAVMNVNITGDERDAILSRWNLIQAQWGTGKGYYNINVLEPVTFTQQNIFCRFKALGYNLLPTGKDEEGLVSITINKKESLVKSQQQQIHTALQNLVSSRQMTVAVQEIRGSTNDTTQILICVSERNATGQSRKIAATDLANFLNSMKAQLATISLTNIAAVVAPSQEEIQAYLSSPPVGIEPRLWHQAQQDNPDPKRYVPVPMIGFSELRSRMACQEAESGRHVAFLSQAKGKLEEMQRKAAESKEKLEQRTLSLRNLQRRLMKVLVKLQVLRREGTALLPIEEELRARLEHIKNIVSQPSHCKVRLGELMSQTELKSFMGSNADYLGKYQLDADSLQELHKYLKMEQEGISHLIDVAGTDTDHLRFMQQDLIQVRQTVIDSNNSVLLTRQAQLTSSFNQRK